MLEFTADGHPPGDSVRIEAGASLRVQGRAVSQYPLDRIEVIRNGVVVAVAKATGDRLSIAIDAALPVERSGWDALRASGPAHPDQPGGSLFGHTGAISLEVPGRPIE